MRRIFRLIPVLAVAAALPALAGPDIPMAAVAHKAPLAGNMKLRYLLRQIELTEPQAKQAEALLKEFSGRKVVGKDETLDSGEIRKLWAELKEAKLANDAKRVGQIARRLKQLGKDTSFDDDFFNKLEPALTDAQKEMLTEAHARLARHPSGGLRPGDMMAEARRLNLTEDQQGALLEAIRASQKRLGPVLRPSEKKKLGLLNHFADDVRALLTPEQRSRFEYRIYMMRPDLIDDGLRVSKSTFKWQDLKTSGD